MARNSITPSTDFTDAPTEALHEQQMPLHVTAMAKLVTWRCRRFAVHLMTVEDMTQIALLAAWESRERWRQMDTEHAASYLSQRMTGAVFDAARSAIGRNNHGKMQIFSAQESDFKQAEMLPSGEDPVSECAVAQALRAVDALPAPLPLIVRRCIEQCELQAIAAEIGVSPSRVTQHLRTLRKIFDRYLYLPPSKNVET